METIKTKITRGRNRKSELEKFKLFYELVVPGDEKDTQVK